VNVCGDIREAALLQGRVICRHEPKPGRLPERSLVVRPDISGIPEAR
jgi:hypothetical protein